MRGSLHRWHHPSMAGIGERGDLSGVIVVPCFSTHQGTHISQGKWCSKVPLGGYVSSQVNGVCNLWVWTCVFIYWYTLDWFWKPWGLEFHVPTTWFWIDLDSLDFCKELNHVYSKGDIFLEGKIYCIFSTYIETGRVLLEDFGRVVIPFQKDLNRWRGTVPTSDSKLSLEVSKLKIKETLILFWLLFEADLSVGSKWFASGMWHVKTAIALSIWGCTQKLKIGSSD